MSSNGLSGLTVHPAVEADIPVMADINYEAYNADDMFRVGFVNWPDEENMRPFFFGRVKGRFEIPGTVMYKAVDENGKMQGFVALTEETEEKKPEAPKANGTANGTANGETNGAVKVGEAVDKPANGSESTPVAPAPNGAITPTSNPPVERDENGRVIFDVDEIRKKTGTGQYFKQGGDGKILLPAYMNQDLMLGIRDTVRPMMEHIADQGKHYYISAFAVRPESQGKGIGSLLMSHCVSVAQGNPAKIPMWLVALPGSHNLCLQHGFRDVQYCDIDLDVYDKQERGYGVYRQWTMTRDML